MFFFYFFSKKTLEIKKQLHDPRATIRDGIVVKVPPTLDIMKSEFMSKSSLKQKLTYFSTLEILLIGEI